MSALSDCLSYLQRWELTEEEQRQALEATRHADDQQLLGRYQRTRGDYCAARDLRDESRVPRGEREKARKAARTLGHQLSRLERELKLRGLWRSGRARRAA